jgi:hypothetical protein
MKTKMKTSRSSVEKLEGEQAGESCRLETLKRTGGYGWASQAEGWARGIETQQVVIGCDVVRIPKRRLLRRPKLVDSRP